MVELSDLPVSGGGREWRRHRGKESTMSGWAELFQGLQFGLQSSAGGRSPRRCLHPDSAASSESPPLTRTMEKEIKPIEEYREEERESYVIFHRSHQKMDHPLNTSLFLLSQSSSPGNFCHLQSEFTKEVVLQKCLLKPPQLTSYLFLISIKKKKKKSFYFHSSSDQTWRWSSQDDFKDCWNFGRPLKYMLSVSLYHISFYFCPVRPKWHSHLSSEDSVKLWYYYIFELCVKCFICQFINIYFQHFITSRRECIMNKHELKVYL